MPASSATFLPPSGCSGHRLRKLGRLMTQHYDRALAPAGLTLNRYAILRHAQAGERTMGALAADLGMDRTTLSRDLRPLEAAGWIALRAHQEDARQRRITVTAAGGRALDAAYPFWSEAQRRVEQRLGGPAVQALHDALDHALRTLSP